MAEIVDSCCVPSVMAGQLTKPDKNNNTTANVDDGISASSEQCDVIEDGIDEKSESTGDSDDRRLSSGGDDEGTNNINNNTVTTETTTVVSSLSSSSACNDDLEVAGNTESTASNINTSTANATSTDPYKDFSGVDTESFITTTLRNNPKDRTLLLTLETLLHQFIQNDEQTSHQFQAMNSYERMIVHRVAAFFGLDHNIDKNGQAVVVTKTPNTRIPNYTFQKCIPEDESTDPSTGASTSENPLASAGLSEIPTRRILRRHERNPNHDHSQRNGPNDEYANHQMPSSNKTQPTPKPYSERVNHYAETRARIFNDTPDPSMTSTTNKNPKNNPKVQSNFVRPSYRKQQQQQQQHQNSLHHHRSYAYQQPTANNHMQQYSTGKTIDPSNHMLNSSTTRNPSIYSTQQPPATNLSIGQASIYAPIITSNPATGSLRPPAATSYYTQAQQPPVDYEYKQQTGGAHIYNYVSMAPPGTSNFIHQQQQLHPQPSQATSGAGSNQRPSHHGAGIPLPILVQQATGQLQYIFPAHALHQQQQQQQPPLPPTNPYPLTPDGQYVSLYRQDNLSIPGPPASVVDNNNTHHHHQYSQSQPYHHHHHHPISQQQQGQQQQQIPPSQSNPAPQPPPFVRIYSTGTPGNVSHPYAQSPYQQPPPPQTAYVQPGTIPGSPFMIPPPQTTAGVQTYPSYDNGVPYNTYGPTGKTNVNNNGVSVQYATNHLSTLNLQNQHDDYQTRLINNPLTRFPHANGSTSNNQQQRNFMGRPLVQSPNGSANPPRLSLYSTSNQQYRPNRPGNHLSNTDKPIPSIENDPKSLTSTQQQNNSENTSLAGPAQE